MSISSLVVFGTDTSPTDRFLPPPERIVRGRPEQGVRNMYSDPSQRFHAGIWTCAVGAWQIAYTEHEFCHLLEGRIRLSDEGGGQIELEAGAAFVIPAGFRGTWETLVPCRKFYAIYE